MSRTVQVLDGDRAKRRLGNACGLTQFGVNLVTLGAGGRSALRHWHSLEDEAADRRLKRLKQRLRRTRTESRTDGLFDGRYGPGSLPLDIVQCSNYSAPTNAALQQKKNELVIGVNNLRRYT